MHLDLSVKETGFADIFFFGEAGCDDRKSFGMMMVDIQSV
jgi:hypothetical protein